MFAIEISLPEVCLEAYLRGTDPSTPLNFFGYTSERQLVSYPQYYPLATFCTTRLIGDYYNSIDGLELLQGSVFYNEHKFSNQNYTTILQNKCLNFDAEYYRADELRERVLDKDVFIKSDKDLKYLTGHVVKAGEPIFIRQSLPDEEVILVSPIKNILSEYRLFVIGSKVVTSSRYRHNDVVEYVPDTPSDVLIFGNEIIDIHLPHEHCVMDIAKMKDGACKLIEFNCINCSAPYASDTSKIFKAFASHVN